MSEYEYIDAISTYRTEIGFHAINYIAAMFGYVATAYFVGPKLSRTQVGWITVLYTMFTPLPILAAHEAGTALRELQAGYLRSFSPDRSPDFMTTNAAELLLFVVFVSWCISIVFMVQARRHARKDQTDGKKNVESAAS